MPTTTTDTKENSALAERPAPREIINGDDPISRAFPTTATMEQHRPSDNMDDIKRVATMFYYSGYFEVEKGSDVATAVAKFGVRLMLGRSIGVGDYQAVSGINIIRGKPTLSAGLMASVLSNHPVFDYRILTSTDTECEIAFSKNGEHLGETSFTLEEAKRANLIKPGGGWTTYPSDMLFARTISRGIRRFCPGIFMGQTMYTPEELAD